ncbi:GAF and ANTAR domain-containing protein [Aeromicrobium ginsengisoli]|uniref:GAF and ANTAR domain-containing protein n=1 Tax=Aeromicrobium ginsengisoli TaxID=363867 RepID=A0A5M4FEP3_9ACTN|nr:GAF and ANTAR domain-containing protein [Aeromicrobium ginsengisoli]KAA1397670.1 GAF and ANTAR domain-containing protein [Aeromicrobium ginsengisoli]
MDEADFLSRIALELDAELTMSSTAELIAEYACLTTAADECGILYSRAVNIWSTPAATSARVAELHQLQVSLDEGPCLDAIRSEPVYICTDARHDDRWPAWGPAAAELGISSALSIRLESKNRNLGALNLYAEPTDAFGPQDVAIAKNFARHASIALSTAFTEEGLTLAIDARTFIGQAQGILMGRYGIGAEQAFEYLRRRSQQENIKLTDIAHEVIDDQDSKHHGQDPERP